MSASATNKSVSESASAAGVVAGGPRAWLQVLGGFLIFFNIWGFPISFGVFQSFYTLLYLPDYTPSAIAWIGTVQNFLLVITGVLAGPLYDLGYFRVLLAVGSFLGVLGIMMLSLSTTYYQVFLSHVCNGIGSGVLYVPTLAVVAQGHTKTRSLAMGIVASGIALGGVIYTIVFLRLEPSSLGFTWTVRVMGFVALAAYIIAIPCLMSGPQVAKGGRARSLIDRSAFTDVPFLTFSFAQLFAFWGYLPPFFYISTFAEVVLKTSESKAFYLLVAAQAASLGGRMSAAAAAHYFGVMAPWVASASISGVLALAWLGITDLSGFTAFSVLYGFVSGALIALPPSIFPAVCERKEVMGTRLGMSWGLVSIASLTGSPIAGALIKLEVAEFVGMQIWSGIMLLVASALLCCLWFMLSRKQDARVWL